MTAATWPTGGSAASTTWKYQGRLDLSPTTTSLYDFAAREYSPGLGAFTSLDSVLGSAQNPWQLNRFLYAAANPATLIDPDGHASGLGGPAAMTTLRQAWQPSDISAHYLLGLIGMFPGIGIPFNAVDAALYAAEGDYVDAALSAVAAVPIAGPLAKLGRVGKTVEEAVKATEEVVTVGRDTDKVAASIVRASDGASDLAKTGEDAASRSSAAVRWDSSAKRFRGADGRFVADSTEPIYRVHGGRSGPLGRSWTPENPTSMANPRDRLGLPNANGGTKLSRARVLDWTGVSCRRALACDGNLGGAVEYLVPEPARQVRIVSTTRVAF